MLEHLRIRNLALIEDMELDFAPGLNVLTGETGAGKSFILKALGFLLGDKLSADMVRPGAKRAQVEALFILDDEELVIHRELLAETGRSRLTVNDSLRSQNSVRGLRERLLVHTSQHGQQQLLQPAFQARLMDSALEDTSLLTRRDDLLARLREVAARRDFLLDKQRTLADKRDVLEMQQQEIDRVAPEEGEEERLQEQSDAIMLGRFEGLMHRMARQNDDLQADAESVSALRHQLAHLSNMLRRPPVADDLPDRDSVEKRLYELAQLKRRLRRNMDEILALRQDILSGCLRPGHCRPEQGRGRPCRGTAPRPGRTAPPAPGHGGNLCPPPGSGAARAGLFRTGPRSPRTDTRRSVDRHRG